MSVNGNARVKLVKGILELVQSRIHSRLSRRRRDAARRRLLYECLALLDIIFEGRPVFFVGMIILLAPSSTECS